LLIFLYVETFGKHVQYPNYSKIANLFSTRLDEHKKVIFNVTSNLCPEPVLPFMQFCHGQKSGMQW